MAKRMSHVASRTRIVHGALGVLEPVRDLVSSNINAGIGVPLSRTLENSRLAYIRYRVDVTEEHRALSCAPKTSRSGCAG